MSEYGICVLRCGVSEMWLVGVSVLSVFSVVWCGVGLSVVCGEMATFVYVKYMGMATKFIFKKVCNLKFIFSVEIFLTPVYKFSIFTPRVQIFQYLAPVYRLCDNNNTRTAKHTLEMFLMVQLLVTGSLNYSAQPTPH